MKRLSWGGRTPQGRKDHQYAKALRLYPHRLESGAPRDTSLETMLAQIDAELLRRSLVGEDAEVGRCTCGAWRLRKSEECATCFTDAATHWNDPLGGPTRGL